MFPLRGSPFYLHFTDEGTTLITSQGHTVNEPGFKPKYFDPMARAVNRFAAVRSVPSYQGE